MAPRGSPSYWNYALSNRDLFHDNCIHIRSCFTVSSSFCLKPWVFERQLRKPCVFIFMLPNWLRVQSAWPSEAESGNWIRSLQFCVLRNFALFCFMPYTLFQRVVEGRVTIIYKLILRRFQRNNQMGILWTLFGVNRSASNLHSTKIYRRDWMAKEKKIRLTCACGQSKELAICKSGTQIRMFPLFNVFPQQRVVSTHWYTQIFRFYSTPTSVPLRLSHQLLHAV